MIDFIDSFLEKFPFCDIILCGDMNRLNTRLICSNCNLKNLHKKPTYGNAELDYILISESLSISYTIYGSAPIDSSSTPHISLLGIPKSVRLNDMKITRPLFDLRSSNIDNFLKDLKYCDWSFLSDDQYDLDVKCEMFHHLINAAFDTSIPVKFISFSENTKPWITPLVKSLINDRWTAFRLRDFARYSFLKEKVKKEIEKSKLIWINKLKRNNVWKMVNEVCSRKTNDAMRSLYNRYESLQSAVDAINVSFPNTVRAPAQQNLPVFPASENNLFPIEVSHVQFASQPLL